MLLLELLLHSILLLSLVNLELMEVVLALLAHICLLLELMVIHVIMLLLY